MSLQQSFWASYPRLAATEAQVLQKCITRFVSGSRKTVCFYTVRKKASILPQAPYHLFCPWMQNIYANRYHLRTEDPSEIIPKMNQAFLAGLRCWMPKPVCSLQVSLISYTGAACISGMIGSACLSRIN